MFNNNLIFLTKCPFGLVANKANVTDCDRFVHYNHLLIIKQEISINSQYVLQVFAIFSIKMHELFAEVLNSRDLSKAGDLFSLADKDIEADLSEVLIKIQEISSSKDYLNSDNDQSVVEICITRVTSAVR